MGHVEEGAKRHYALRHDPLSIFAADLLLPSSSVANAVRLPQVSCESESEKWKVKSESESESESEKWVIFGSLKFLELLYVIRGVLT